MRASKWDGIDQVTELFKLEEVAPNHYTGLVYPVCGSVFSYGRPALGLYGRIQENLTEELNSGTHGFVASIYSIDDSGLTIYGPRETQEKAVGRLNKFISFIKSLQFRCPTREEMQQFDKDAGTYSEFW